MGSIPSGRLFRADDGRLLAVPETQLARMRAALAAD